MLVTPWHHGDMSSRRTRRSAGIILALAAMVLGSTPANAAPGDPIDRNDRASVVAGYQGWLVPQLSVPVGWTGSTADCNPGTSSEESQAATLSAVNYMRAMAGLAPVSRRADLVPAAQAAALVMAANEDLSHNPPKSWRCWTPEAAKAASHSNIGLTIGGDPAALTNATGARVVVLYMEDDGDVNASAGHRRWLLYQRLAVIASGDTNTSNALYVVTGTRAPRTKGAWVSWPTPGFFPRELEPKGRWSLSYPGADFSRARVEMSGPNGPLSVRRNPLDNGAGDNSLVWQVDLASALGDPAVDVPLTVSVRGIRVRGKTIPPVGWTTTLITAS